MWLKIIYFWVDVYLKRFIARNEKFSILLLLIPLIVLIPSFLKASFFTKYDLKVNGKVIDILVDDLNFDGLKDLLVIHVQGLVPRETRLFSLFWQRTDNSFTGVPDQSWEVDSRATVADTGDVDPAWGKEIIYLTGKEVAYYRLDKDQYESGGITLVKAEAMTVFPEKDHLPCINFVRDWNGDGSDDIAVFNFGEISIFIAEPAYVFNKVIRLTVEQETSLYTYNIMNKGIDSAMIPSFSALYTFPQLSTRDLNGDGKEDLVAIREDNLTYFLNVEGGTFSPVPHKKYFNVRTREEKREEFINLRMQVNDLDGDGLADAVVFKQRIRGLTSLTGKTYIFYNHEGEFHDTPDQLIITEEAASIASLARDMDNDGKLDLIMPSFRFGVTAIIRYFLTRQIKVTFPVFFMQEDKRYLPKPDIERTLRFKIDLTGKFKLRLIDIDGDFNGDGIKDLAMGTNDNQLSIFHGLKNPGEVGRIFSFKAERTLEINTLAQFNSGDLTGDGRSDMILFYPRNTELLGLIKVLIGGNNDF